MSRKCSILSYLFSIVIALYTFIVQDKGNRYCVKTVTHQKNDIVLRDLYLSFYKLALFKMIPGVLRWYDDCINKTSFP